MTTPDDTPPDAPEALTAILAAGEGRDLWVVVFEPLPGVVVPAGRRMARLLKSLGRYYGLECRFCGDRVPLPVTIQRKTPRPRKRP